MCTSITSKALDMEERETREHLGRWEMALRSYEMCCAKMTWPSKYLFFNHVVLVCFTSSCCFSDFSLSSSALCRNTATQGDSPCVAPTSGCSVWGEKEDGPGSWLVLVEVDGGRKYSPRPVRTNNQQQSQYSHRTRSDNSGPAGPLLVQGVVPAQH